jgi:AraC-like DNA-binding protein
LVLEPDLAVREHDKQRFQQWRLDLAVGTSERVKIAELEVEARLRRLADNLSLNEPAHKDAALPSVFNVDIANKVEQMTRYIGDRYRDPISTNDIGGAVNLHPKYASALFKKHLGMTIGAYLCAQRLSQAKRLLATTELKIADIAFETGFSSLSRFYDVFQRECSQTPKEYRSSLQTDRFATATLHQARSAYYPTPCSQPGTFVPERQSSQL